MESTLVGWDWLVIAVYFGAIGGIAWWSSRRNTNTQEYFLAGRNVGFFAIGCSLLASNVGSEHIVGLAGQGATTGMAMAHWELHAWIIVLLAYFFVPFYYRSGVFTVPEFLEKRFDTRCRWVLSLVSLFGVYFDEGQRHCVCRRIGLSDTVARRVWFSAGRLLGRGLGNGGDHRNLHGFRGDACRGVHRIVADDCVSCRILRRYLHWTQSVRRLE